MFFKWLVAWRQLVSTHFVQLTWSEEGTKGLLGTIRVQSRG